MTHGSSPSIAEPTPSPFPRHGRGERWEARAKGAPSPCQGRRAGENRFRGHAPPRVPKAGPAPIPSISSPFREPGRPA